MINKDLLRNLTLSLAMFLTAFSWGVESWSLLQCRTIFTAKLQRSAPLTFQAESPQSRWLQARSEISSLRILKNMSPDDGIRGSVVAGQSTARPNYHFHWIRDAALVIEALITRYESTDSYGERFAIRQELDNYIDFSHRIQKLRTISGLGEPKFNVNGTAFNEPWGRPQNDGPALRAISMLQIARIFKAEGRISEIRSRLYDGQIPTNSVIKMDLEYIAHHWSDASYDLWEEVLGAHFYTRMVQRRALLEGADLAHELGDEGAARFYKLQAELIEKDIFQRFWNTNNSFILSSLDWREGLQGKASNLDMSVVLALLHGSTKDHKFRFSDPLFLSTLRIIEARFAELYPVNQLEKLPGVAVGRYPEDSFCGPDRSQGNPWFLTTLAMAEAYYRAAYELRLERKPEWQSLVAKGDEFVARVQVHAGADGAMSEQFDRNDGHMTSVPNLSWSHASLLTALEMRKLAVRDN